MTLPETLANGPVLLIAAEFTPVPLTPTEPGAPREKLADTSVALISTISAAAPPSSEKPALLSGISKLRAGQREDVGGLPTPTTAVPAMVAREAVIASLNTSAVLLTTATLNGSSVTEGSIPLLVRPVEYEAR